MRMLVWNFIAPFKGWLHMLVVGSLYAFLLNTHDFLVIFGVSMKQSLVWHFVMYWTQID